MSGLPDTCAQLPVHALRPSGSDISVSPDTVKGPLGGPPKSLPGHVTGPGATTAQGNIGTQRASVEAARNGPQVLRLRPEAPSSPSLPAFGKEPEEEVTWETGTMHGPAWKDVNGASPCWAGEDIRTAIGACRLGAGDSALNARDRSQGGHASHHPGMLSPPKVTRCLASWLAVRQDTSPSQRTRPRAPDRAPSPAAQADPRLLAAGACGKENMEVKRPQRRMLFLVCSSVWCF